MAMGRTPSPLAKASCWSSPRCLYLDKKRLPDDPGISHAVSNQPVAHLHNDTYLGRAYFTGDRPVTFADRAQCLTECATYNPPGIAHLEPVAP